MANRVHDRSRSGIDVSGGEDSEEKEKKPVRQSSEKSVQEVSTSWNGSDSDSEPENETVQTSGTVRIRRVSTRALDQAHQALQQLFGPATTAATTSAATTATSTTTSTTAGPPTAPPAQGDAQQRKENTPQPKRHAMPDGSIKTGKRKTSLSPTRPRFVGDKPKVLESFTGSPPSSPQRPRAPSSVQPAQVPVPARPGPAAPVDAVDRNIATALAVARKVATRKGAGARLKEFMSGLSLASAISPGARGKVVLALARSLPSVPEDARGICIAELRELSGDMPAEFRRELLQLLLQQFTSNRDSSTEDSSETDAAVDAEQFAKAHEILELRCAAIGKLMKGEMSDDALSKLALKIGTVDSAHVVRASIRAVIIGLEAIDARCQDKVVALFDDASIPFEEVLGALLDSPHGRTIGNLAKNSGHSLSALYFGTLTGNRAAMQKLLLILGNTLLPASLHLYLAEKIGAHRRTAAPAPTIATASRTILLEIVSLSAMSEAQRCLLMQALSAIDENKLHVALKGGELNDANDYWAYAHELIANVVDAGSCLDIGRDDNPDPCFASFALRARKLMKDDMVKMILDQGKCTWDAPRLRRLMLGSDDVKAIKKAVFEVLCSNLPFAEKLGLLKAQADPLGESIEAESIQARYEEAVRYYKKKYLIVNLDKDLAYAVVKDNQKKRDEAYETLTRDLDTVALDDIRIAGHNAMLAAQRSRLPAMHVTATMEKKSGIVRGYMETVLGFADKLKEEEIAACLELSHNGMSLFYHAMMNAPEAVVEACIPVILDSELSLKTKIPLLEARRQADRLGAFYMAMSMGLTNSAIKFVEGVLQNETITDDTKLQLLQCAKPAHAKKTGSDRAATRLSKALKEAATTARAEAGRRKHERLESEFCYKVERSTLKLQQKTLLQTT
nr:hypothetical protein [uncultured Noviherbaspirillum sp.]